MLLLINNQIRYISLNYYLDLKPMEIPNKIAKKILTKYFEFDRYNKVVYFLSKTGIDRIYYDSENSIENHKMNKFIFDVTIMGFKLDSNNHHLIYYTKNSIVIVDIFTRIRINIYKTKKHQIIYYLKYEYILGLKFLITGLLFSLITILKINNITFKRWL